MTDTELEEIEEKANEHPASWYVLDLIAELRQTRAERDWLARIFGTLPDRECPPNRRRWSMECSKVTCEECWLKAAKEATCQTKNS